MSVSELSLLKNKQDFDYNSLEFNASEVRKILQELFPTRKLVLSQFTFFNQIGVSKPSGQNFRRGRRCYRAADLLPIAVILALKEQGIPNKNINKVPEIIQENSEKIFKVGLESRISGFIDTVSLNFAGESSEDLALQEMLESPYEGLFWSFDVGSLARDIVSVVVRFFNENQTTKESHTSLRAVA